MIKFEWCNLEVDFWCTDMLGFILVKYLFILGQCTLSLEPVVKIIISFNGRWPDLAVTKCVILSGWTQKRHSNNGFDWKHVFDPV